MADVDPGRYLAILLAMTADSITGIAYTLQAREVFPPYARITAGTQRR